MAAGGRLPVRGETDSPPQRRNPPRAKGFLNRRFEWFSLVTFFLQKKKVTRAEARNAPSRARRQCPPNIPAALAATYPLRCFAPQWARFDNRHSTSAPTPILSLHQRQRRRDNFAPRRELLLSAVTKVAKSTGRNCVSALPQRAMPVHCHLRFPSRNRRFPDRCRSPDCASTAFRCRCLLLRQKLFVLPCRRLRNNYILCPTGTPTFAALRRQRRDLIIAKTDQRTRSYPRTASAAAAQEVQAIPEPTMLPTALHARVHTAKSA